MGHISKERYEQKKIDRLINHLRFYYDKGHPIDFEIFVDGFKVVRRTSDLEMFSMYEDFVDADTKTVEFLFYTGNSNNNHKHIFHFGETPRNEPQKEELSGVDLSERIEEGVEQRMKEAKYAKLEDDNRKLEASIKELEKEVEGLEKEKEELLAKQSPLNSFLGDIGSSLVESFIRRNPKLMSSIPGGEALAGLIEGEPGQQQADHSKDSHVSFQPKSASSSALSEEDQSAIIFVNQLKSQFTKD